MSLPATDTIRLKGLLIWGICALFFLYEFLLRTLLGTFQRPLMQDLGLSAFEFSLLSTSLFALIYGLMQIPASIIINRWGLKKSLLLACSVCALSTLMFSSSHHFYTALISRILMGFGASFGFIGILIAVHDWTPRRYSALFIGLSQFIGTLGPMLATGPLEALSDASSPLSWRTLFWIIGFIGIALSVLIALFVEHNQTKSGQYTIIERPQPLSVLIKRLFQTRTPWLIAILSTCLFFTLEYLSENEGRRFLMLKGASPQMAGYLLTLSWIGYAIGCPVLGALSDYFERRLIWIKLSALLGVVSIATLLYAQDLRYLPLAFLGIGVSASGQSIGFSLMAEQFKRPFIAIGFGLNNAMIFAISAMNAPLLGHCLEQVSTGDSLQLHDYFTVFHALLALLLLATVIVFFMLKETYGKSQADLTVIRP